MKKESPVYALLHKPLLLSAVVIVSLLGIIFVVGQALRYYAHGKIWWFEDVSSCSGIMIFLYLTSCLIYYNIPERNMKTVTKEVVKHVVLLNVAYSIGFGIVLFPVLLYYGFKWYNLCAAFIYILGFYNLCFIPLRMSKSGKSFLWATCPLILFAVIETLFENNTVVSLALLVLFGLAAASVVVSLFIHKK
ncbi:MAG: hypothetical protein J6O54_04440 [Prevotella sp.]|nr:hypothetical protein [Prevotella sp.]